MLKKQIIIYSYSVYLNDYVQRSSWVARVSV